MDDFIDDNKYNFGDKKKQIKVKRKRKMSIYRSQTVQRFKLYLPRQSAWNLMDSLGQRKLIHVITTHSDQIIRHSTLQVRRIDEAIMKVSRLEQVLIHKKMTDPLTYIDQLQFPHIYRVFDTQNKEQPHKQSANYVNTLIDNIDELWQYYSQVSKRLQMLQKQIQNSRQNIAILLAGQKQYGRSFFTNQPARYQSYHQINSSINKINYKAGVINLSSELRFKKTVFRISKGNSIIMTKPFSEIFTNLQPQQVTKIVFFVIYPANPLNYFDTKLTKLISVFSDHTFDHYSQPLTSFQNILAGFNKSYKQAISLKQMCENQIQSFLYEKLLHKVTKNKQEQLVPDMKKYQYLKLYLIKEKIIYQNLNQMDIYNHFFQSEIFIRKDNIKQVQKILSFSQGSRQLPPGNIVPIGSHQKYPTSFVLNDYTRPAQQIVETYGVPRYKEINPSIFTTITFPFLFGVMFGDIGHGSILLAFGLWLIWKEQKIKTKNYFILRIILPYRYLIGLMGFFAVYCGIIYNDFLSIALNIFGSCYELQDALQTQAISRISSDCVYPIGLDPVWSVAENNLNYTNSLKMKISVIIGVVHMVLGVFLRFMNDLYFKNYKQIVFVFSSQLAFLIVLFGYMDFLIVYKWLVPWGTERNTAMAPSVITQMIDIPLSFGSTSGKPLWDQSNQQNLQYVLFLVAALSIPLMFFPVPLMKIFKIERRNNKTGKQSPRKPKYSLSSDMEMQINEMLIDKQEQIDLSDNHDNKAHDQEQTASQILVHQAIQTIQFVLGCVSNTASYLRLWALSLAHSQLSEVFFQKTVQHSLTVGWSGILMNLIGFSLLASITFGIMLLMDSMECFLHTLRLHWVQFQNKFYKGDGFSFKNYNFALSINQQLRKNSIASSQKQ